MIAFLKFGGTLQEYGGPQKRRGTEVENHWFRVREETTAYLSYIKGKVLKNDKTIAKTNL